jgi:pyruvate dehydrogenase E1 component alpha subunit
MTPRKLVRVLPSDEPSEMRPAPALGRDALVQLLQHMLFCRVLDEKMLGMQRQGRIGFYGPGAGQEAAVIGSASAFAPEDWIFPALREGAALLIRGFPLHLYIAQMIGNSIDLAKGRQMPCHFSSGKHRFLSLSSVIGTQIPQAVGAAHAAKIRGERVVTGGYLGDGATSSSDFHVAMNFAQVYGVPCVLVCQNNQWAISVPFAMQTASDGIAVKAHGYGMEGVAVDGNDILAVYAVTKAAVDKARAGGGPTLIEAVTYRRGGHSSSDDPTRYRDEKAVAPWLLRDPIERYRDWLRATVDWTDIEEEAFKEEARGRIDAAIKAAEAAAAPAPETLFDDVYASLPLELARQRQGCLDSLTGGQNVGAFPL